MSKTDPGVRALAALPSLGLTSAQMLFDAGVPDVETLHALGPIGAYRRLRFHFGKRAVANYAYAVECAIRGLDGRDLEPERVAEFKAEAHKVAAELNALIRKPD